MKQKIFYSLFIVALTTCHKNITPEPDPDPATDNYVRMNVDGVPVEIKGYADNQANLINSLANLRFETPTDDVYNPYFTCSVYNATPNTTGTYSIGDGSANQITYRKILSPTTAVEYFAQGSLGHATLNIGKVKSIGGGINAINGTFSGTLYTPIGGDSIVITDGEFFDQRTD